MNANFTSFTRFCNQIRAFGMRPFVARNFRRIRRGNSGRCVLTVALALTTPVLALAQASAVRPRITAAVDDTVLTPLHGNTHPLARPQYDQGAVADSQPMNRMLLLLQRGPDQEAALRQLIDQQQSKASANFHQWLTPQQFGLQFGPADSDIQTVTNWLQSHGFQVARVSAGRTVIEFSGNAGQVRNAFHTEIHRYLVNGKQYFANNADPQIPTALAPVVAGTVSLHNFPKKPLVRAVGVFTKTKATGEVKPLQRFAPARAGTPLSPAFTFAFNGCSLNSNNCYAVGPADFDTIYNVPSLGGAGQTVAIVGDSEICTKNSPDFGTSYIGPLGNEATCSADDVAQFRSLFGLPANSPNVILDGPDPGFNGDEIEGDLDVEWSGAVAPNATIDFVIAEDTEASNGIDLAAEHIVDNNLAPVLSESFGACEAYLGLGGNEFYTALWEQAAAQGITVIISAGDSGSAGCDDENSEATAVDGLAVNGIASTPYNVATGGTDFDYTSPTLSSYATTYWKPQSGNASGTDESAIGYIPETAWNDSCAQSFINDCGSTNSTSSSLNIVGGSGGQSNCLNASVNLSGYITGCAAAFNGSSLLGYPKPVWQPVAYASGLGITTDVTRDLPDVSLFASDGLMSASFYIICEQDLDVGDAPCNLSTSEPFYSFVAVGGTSSSAPTFAATMALINQKMASLGLSARQGDANYVLYPLYNNQVNLETPCNSSVGPSSQCTFNDVTKGNNSVPCLASSRNCSTALGTGDLVYSGSPAWNAGTGYDLSTGLGTLNVTNLITNWATAVGSFTSSTTTLCLVSGNTSSPNCSPLPTTLSITHGQTVSGNIIVRNTSNQVLSLTSSYAQPEDAALIGVLAGGVAIPVDRFDVNTGNADIYPLTSGQFSGAFTNELVGGTYTLHAHYAGDGKYGSSDSNAISVTVTPESSTARECVLVVNAVTEATEGTVSTNPYSCSSATTAQYGDFNLIRVDVVGASGLETAAGSVTLTDNGNAVVGPTGTTVSAFNLNADGYFEDQTSYLAVGSHKFVATYTGINGDGDGSYNPSPSSSTLSLTVTQCNTAATITTPSTTIQPGQSVKITVFIDSATSGNPSVGSSGANMGGTITFTTPTQAAAFGPVSSVRTPTMLPTAAVGASLIFLLLIGVRFPVRRRWGVALTIMLLAIVLGTSISCGGGTGGSGASGGGSTTTLGTVAPTATVDGDGFVAGQASITITPSGTETITATYSGDANYNGSTSNSVTITVQ